MLKARQCHRQLRAKQRGAVAPRHGLEPSTTPAAARRPATATEVARHVVVKTLELLAFVALSQVWYRLASWVALPVPGSVVAVGMLFSLLSGRRRPSRSAERLAAMLRNYLTVCFMLVAVGILAFGDFSTARGLAIALTLLGSAIIGLAIVRARRRLGPNTDASPRFVARPTSTAGSFKSFPIPARLSPS